MFPEVKAGDILFTGSTSFVQKVIKIVTRSNGEPPTEVGHMGFVVSQTHLVEAVAKGTKKNRVDSYKGKKGVKVAVYRPLNLTPEEISIMVKEAEDHVGDFYGYGKLLGHLVYKYTGKDWLLRKLAKDPYEICSQLVSLIFRKVGKNFGVDDALATPDDIWDFVNANPDKYECIYPLSEMK